MSKKNRRTGRRTRGKQRSWIVLLAGGVVLFGLAFLFLRGKTDAQPPITIEVHGAPSLKADRQQIDLGDIKLGQFVQASFRLTNVGDQPLRFSEAPYIEVVSGC